MSKPNRICMPLLVVVWMLAGNASPRALATTIFSGTGLEFYNDPAASFPTVAPNVVGNSIDLLPSATNQVLAVYPLVPAGLPQDAVRKVTIQLNLTRLTADFDPDFYISDGTHVVGGQIGDNPGGSARLMEGTLSADGKSVTPTNTPLLFDNAGFAGVGGSFAATIEVLLDTPNRVSVAFFSGSGSAPTQSFDLDTTAGLSFLFVSNGYFTSTPEQYRLNTLLLDVQYAVPEPTGALAAFALALCALARRRGPAVS